VIWWVGSWMADNTTVKKSKRIVARSSDEKDKAEFWPMPGRHYAWYRGRLMIFDRAVEQKLEGARETWSIWLRGSRALMEEFVEDCRKKYVEETAHTITVYVGGGCQWNPV